MKSQVHLFKLLLEQIAADCGTSATMDWKTIHGRVVKEGMSFLTLTLPRFEGDLIVAIDRGHIGSDLFHGFKRGKAGLPRFLSGFLRQIFDHNGLILPVSEQQIRAIRSLRQLCCFYKKIELDCSPARVKAVLDAYVQTDLECQFEPDDSLSEFSETCRHYLGDFFSAIEKELLSGAFSPKHSSGAVADKTHSNQKWASRQWAERLERTVTYYEACASNASDFLTNPPQYIEEGREQPVRVVLVPKTMKGPRVIAIEPLYMQYVQQGLLSLFTEVLERRKFRWLNERMGWGSQVPNQELAKEGSITGRFATIDLSEASDRVSLAHVRAMLKHHPLLMEWLNASRSRWAELPDGRIVPLRKFASMGSAMCFPVESLVFTAIILHQVRKNRTHPNHHKPGRGITKFRVYGDDMIVPVDMVPSMLRDLELFKLKVNHTKSFWNGSFRESCGSEWYAGYDVSYVKARAPLPGDRLSGERVLKAIALHNHLFQKGLYNVCDDIASRLKKLGYNVYAPYGARISALYTWDETLCKTRFNPGLQRLEYRAIRDNSRSPIDQLSEYGALRKWFRIGVSSKDIESLDELLDGGRIDEWEYAWKMRTLTLGPDHLERSGRPRSVAIKVGWSASR